MRQEVEINLQVRTSWTLSFSDLEFMGGCVNSHLPKTLFAAQLVGGSGSPVGPCAPASPSTVPRTGRLSCSPTCRSRFITSPALIARCPHSLHPRSQPALIAPSNSSFSVSTSWRCGAVRKAGWSSSVLALVWQQWAELAEARCLFVRSRVPKWVRLSAHGSQQLFQSHVGLIYMQQRFTLLMARKGPW